MRNWTLITGASEGLGVEFAHLAAKDGHDIILTARSEDKLNLLAAELREMHRDVIVIPADLSDLSEVERLWSEASEGRVINVLVNNAGLGRNDPFGNGEDWARARLGILHRIPQPRSRLRCAWKYSCVS